MPIARMTIALAAIAALSACNMDRGDDDAAPEPVETSTAEPTPTAEEPVSILRSDIEQPDLPEPPLEPLNVTVGFPDGGSDLDEAATAAIMEVTGSEQLLLQGPIVLRGHSDAGGSDAANMRASQMRAESVRDFMIDMGVDEDRFTIITFGEQNPVEPNALPDGSPNEAGRAANRRVEFSIVPPEGERIDDQPSAETSD